MSFSKVLRPGIPDELRIHRRGWSEGTSIGKNEKENTNTMEVYLYINKSFSNLNITYKGSVIASVISNK